MKLSSDPSREAGPLAAPGARLSILEVELPAVELERHKESSSKLFGSTLLKISVKSRRLARGFGSCAMPGQHDVSLRPLWRPFVAVGRLELREVAE
jgi:hypothetical protein